MKRDECCADSCRSSPEKRKQHSRLRMSAVLSLFVFVVLLLTMLIMTLIAYLLVRLGLFEAPNRMTFLAPFLIMLITCIVVGTALSFAMSRLPLKPIRKIIAATNRLAKGDFSTRLEIDKPPEFVELSESFNRMAVELGGIELLRTDFVNNFSHEFKTPIVSIKGFAEMLKSGDLSPEEQREYLDIIIAESARLSTLATNVLNLSKVENQTILAERRVFNLGEQIRRSALMLEPKWEGKHIKLTVDVEDIPYNGNEELLCQVWLNLVDNAVKFTPEGGDVSLGLACCDGAAVFTISDSGLGIPGDKLPHIFDKFYQADTSHATDGNGLGLTLAKRIVELHGGSIGCESEIGRGTNYTVRLPVE